MPTESAGGPTPGAAQENSRQDPPSGALSRTTPRKLRGRGGFHQPLDLSRTNPTLSPSRWASSHAGSGQRSREAGPASEASPKCCSVRRPTTERDEGGLVRAQRRGQGRVVVGELPDPEPTRGEVRVRVGAARINPADVKRRSGVGRRRMGAPRIVRRRRSRGARPGRSGRTPARVGSAPGCTPPPTAGRSGHRRSSSSCRPRARSSCRLTRRSRSRLLRVPALTAHRASMLMGRLTAWWCSALAAPGRWVTTRSSLALARRRDRDRHRQHVRQAAAGARRGRPITSDYRRPDASAAVSSSGRWTESSGRSAPTLRLPRRSSRPTRRSSPGAGRWLPLSRGAPARPAAGRRPEPERTTAA